MYIPVYKYIVVGVAADHIRKHERISGNAVEQHRRYERLEPVVWTPVRILVH